MFVLHTIRTGYHHWGNNVSLYYTQKLLYQLNRDQSLQEKFFADKESVITDYELTEEEHAAIVTPDIGLLYILGVNGQILMHFVVDIEQKALTIPNTRNEFVNRKGDDDSQKHFVYFLH